MELELIRNRHELMAFILALTRDRDAAEEVFQETAVAILSEASRGRVACPFMPWAREVARRRVLEYYRKSSARATAPLPNGVLEAVCDTFAEEEEAVDSGGAFRIRLLEECFQKLTVRLQELLELRYRSRMSPGEIAQAKGLQPGSVKVMLARARKALAECVRIRSLPLEGTA
ncbi:MAG: RNA polymerase sigma factor [Planctomycetota bacterium]